MEYKVSTFVKCRLGSAPALEKTPAHRTEYACPIHMLSAYICINNDKPFHQFVSDLHGKFFIHKK